MFIRTENEIKSLMPTSKWSQPEQLYGYLEEEERVALEPLLGTPLYLNLCTECERLRASYTDITSTTIKPTGTARKDARVSYAHVTDRLDDISEGKLHPDETDSSSSSSSSADKSVSRKDLQTVNLLRICQQIEFYKMLAHKAGLLGVSFNEGGGLNVVSADGYDPADDKNIDRAVKDAYMSAGRAVDSLLIFLEADAKSDRFFTDLWSQADAFYIHKDLLFQTARVLNEYLDIKGERKTYVSLVRDIRFCQNTYIKPRIGATLLKAIVEYASGTEDKEASSASSSAKVASMPDRIAEELIPLFRTALAFYVESRRTNISRLSLTVSTSARGTGSSIEKEERLARRDSMTDAQQAMAMACDYIAENLEALGDAAVGTPIYNIAREREAQAAQARASEQAAECRRRKAACEQSRKRLFTAFPATHRTPEVK